jgi:hypothetical protein
MSIPRYSPNPLWFGMPIVDNKEGKLCEYRDYAKLEADYARLKAENDLLHRVLALDPLLVEAINSMRLSQQTNNER